MNNKVFKFFILFCCLFCFSGCGLDEFYELDPPTQKNHGSNADTTDYSLKYFEFTTNETGSNNSQYLDESSSFTFLGTAVYYKIYNNLASLNSDISAISSLSTSTNYSNAVSRIRETLGYQELGLADFSSGVRGLKTESPLIPAIGKNRRIYIRLTNYMDTYKAEVRIDNVPIAEIPCRVGSEKAWSFDFGCYDDDKDVNVLPEENDVDYKKGSFTVENKYYVNLYAMAVGKDTTFSNYYSNVLHLGSVPIFSSERDN